MAKPERQPTPRELVNSVREFFAGIEILLNQAADAEQRLPALAEEESRLKAEIEGRQKRLADLAAQIDADTAREREADLAAVAAQQALAEAEKAGRQRLADDERKRQEAQAVHEEQLAAWAKTEQEAKQRVEALESRLRDLRVSMERTIDNVLPS